MRVPLSWLREYVDFDLSPAGLAEKLTMAGLAVEEIEDLAAPLTSILVGRIVSLKPHPSSERLLLAETDWGAGPRTLVTGARNLAPGDLVPVAPVGAVLPDGRAIDKATFNGVVSEGMLCSGAELGLEKKSTGILVLAGEWTPGTPAAKALGLDETVLVLELTPNRGDCLGILGVAREVAAVTGGQLRLPPAAPVASGPACSNLARVTVEDPDLCPRYSGKVLLDIIIQPSPLWMQSRLRAAGIRPINNLVDITNYVLLELNQPLHAFDLDRLQEQRLIIRRAAEGERLQTLDEMERALPAGALIIADPSGPVALAGVMGGASSEVTATTAGIFLEGAYFDRVSIRKTAKALGMRTEASLRFERGIDPAAVLFALDRAAYLLEELGAGTVAAGTIDENAGNWRPRTIMVNPARINEILGTDLSAAESAGYLRRLQFEVAEEKGMWTVTVPTYRNDVQGPEDLAEEVARLYGYDRIPSTYPAGRQVGHRTLSQDLSLRTRRILRGLGQTEVMTYSFTSPRIFDRLGLPSDDPCRRALRILAPLSEEWSVMRPLLLGSILEVMAVNSRHGTNDVSIFELAHVYRPVSDNELPHEPLHLAGGITGAANMLSWAEKSRPADFYDLKGLLETILNGLGVRGISFAAARMPGFHPGRCAVLRGREGETIGVLGEAHPRVIEAFDLRGPAYLYEIDFARLISYAQTEPQVKSLPRHPAIRRDLAVVVPDRLALDELMAKIRELGGELLVDLELFDVYTGERIGRDRRSMAFTLVFRAPDRTLTDTEAAAAVERILKGLSKEFGAELR